MRVGNLYTEISFKQLKCTCFERYLEAGVLPLGTGVARGWILSATSDDGG